MTEFKAGDKVKLNANYWGESTGFDEFEEQIVGEATVLEMELGLIVIKFDSGAEWSKDRNDWRFGPEELDKL